MAETLTYLEQNYAKGDLKAGLELGQHFLIGRGTSVNEEQAYHYIREAAHGKVAEGQYYLALLYAQGLGTHVHLDKMFYWLEASASQGYEQAQVRLNEVYGVFRLTTIDRSDHLPSVVPMLTNTALHGDTTCLYRLLLLHIYGIGVRYDLTATLRLLTLAWLHDEPHAKAFVSHYAKGETVEARSLTSQQVMKLSLRSILARLTIPPSVVMQGNPYLALAKFFPSNEGDSSPCPLATNILMRTSFPTETIEEPEASLPTPTMSVKAILLPVAAVLIVGAVWGWSSSAADEPLPFFAIPAALIVILVVRSSGFQPRSTALAATLAATLLTLLLGEFLSHTFILSAASSADLQDVLQVSMSTFSAYLSSAFTPTSAVCYLLALLIAFLLGRK